MRRAASAAIAAAVGRVGSAASRAGQRRCIVFGGRRGVAAALPSDSDRNDPDLDFNPPPPPSPLRTQVGGAGKFAPPPPTAAPAAATSDATTAASATRVCDVCKIDMPEDSWTLHLRGKKHTYCVARESIIAQGIATVPPVGVPLDPWHVWCGVCRWRIRVEAVGVTPFQKWQQHLDSPGHIKRAKIHGDLHRRTASDGVSPPDADNSARGDATAPPELEDETTVEAATQPVPDHTPQTPAAMAATPAFAAAIAAEVAAKAASDEEEAKLAALSAAEAKAAAQERVECTDCAVTIPKIYLNDHRRSKRHRFAVLRKCIEADGVACPPPPGVTLAPWQVWCGTCREKIGIAARVAPNRALKGAGMTGSDVLCGESMAGIVGRAEALQRWYAHLESPEHVQAAGGATEYRDWQF